MCSGASPNPTLYDVLGVSLKATGEEIRLSYLRLARAWHPDRHGGSDSAKRKFQQIQCAYEVLSNDRRRASYDLQWLELLDVEDYLSRFKDLILTANGLGLSFSSLTQQQQQAAEQQGGGGPADNEWGPAPFHQQPAIKAA